MEIFAGVKKLISEIPPSASGATAAYLSAWTKSFCDVLAKIAGSAFGAVELAAGELADQAEILQKEGVWLRFTSGNSLQGEQSFGVCKSEALRLAQILMGEPLDGTQDFSSDYEDALAELFRQFAGATALAVKPLAGGDVSLQFAGYGLADWKPHLQWGVRLKSEEAGQFLLVICLDPVLGESLALGSSEKADASSARIRRRSLRSRQARSSEIADAPSTRSAPIASTTTGKDKRNIDLLLDIELQVALRFGKREMQLGDILEFSARLGGGTGSEDSGTRGAACQWQSCRAWGGGCHGWSLCAAGHRSLESGRAD